MSLNLGVGVKVSDATTEVLGPPLLSYKYCKI